MDESLVKSPYPLSDKCLLTFEHNFKLKLKYLGLIMKKNILTLFLENNCLKMRSYFNLVVLLPNNKMELWRAKNRHLLEVARALMFTSGIPKSFSREVVFTTFYLINRMPIKILGFETPLNHFS